MTVYDAKVKIGCLVNTERLRTPSPSRGGGVTVWTEEYATTRMVLPLPGAGVDESPHACPVCSLSYTIRRSSPARIYQYLQWALLGAAAVCILLATVGILLPLKDPDPFPRRVAYGFAAVGFVGLIGAMFCPILPANLLRGDLVKIRDDDARNRPPAPGDSGMRGHKILDVHISERHAAEAF